MAPSSSESYIRFHHVRAYVRDAVVQLVSSNIDDPLAFLLAYFSQAARGHHVLRREYDFTAATPHNRVSFLRLVAIHLSKLDEAGPLTIADAHSALRLLCPDFPLSALKNAWNLALGIYIEAAANTRESSLGQQEAKLNFQDFLKCMEITFVFEKYLVDIRRKYFDGDRLCQNVADMMNSMVHVSKWEDAMGWPAPPAAVLVKALNQASKGSEKGQIEFRQFVKMLIGCGDEARVLWNKVSDCYGEHGHLLEAAAVTGTQVPHKKQPERARKKGMRNKLH